MKETISMVEVIELIKGVKADTKNFKENILNNIIMPDNRIPKPSAVVLSYIEGVYIINLMPYGNYKIDKQGEVVATSNNEHDHKLVENILSKNTKVLKEALLDLENNPPQYYIGHVKPTTPYSEVVENGVSILKKYMSSIYQAGANRFEINSNGLRLVEAAKAYEVKYSVAKNKTFFSVKGIEITSPEAKQTALDELLAKEYPIENLPDVLKTKLEKQQKKDSPQLD